MYVKDLSTISHQSIESIMSEFEFYSAISNVYHT
jgi:hypothetical protein